MNIEFEKAVEVIERCDREHPSGPVVSIDIDENDGIYDVHMELPINNVMFIYEHLSSPISISADELYNAVIKRYESFGEVCHESK